jgi:hypothetical protein
MACDGQGMILVVVPIHVGNLQIGFENGCFERHDGLLFDAMMG